MSDVPAIVLEAAILTSIQIPSDLRARGNGSMNEIGQS